METVRLLAYLPAPPDASVDRDPSQRRGPEVAVIVPDVGDAPVAALGRGPRLEDELALVVVVERRDAVEGVSVPTAL
jgi:hypothetical protein